MTEDLMAQSEPTDEADALAHITKMLNEARPVFESIIRCIEGQKSSSVIIALGHAAAVHAWSMRDLCATGDTIKLIGNAAEAGLRAIKEEHSQTMN